MVYLILIIVWWVLCSVTLFVCKYSLFAKTWRELYLKQAVVVVESDDWGPGDQLHATRLKVLLGNFSKIKDSTGRCAVLTADIVLAVPDGRAIKETSFSEYHRKLLCNSFPEIFNELKQGIEDGTLVPQLHGLEHLNGEGIVSLGKRDDPRTGEIYENNDWWDWETLDSPLQGHYVNGSKLPTKPLSKEELSQLVEDAVDTFKKTFGFLSASTVAPCYLWDDEVEDCWSHQGINIIQSAGYRCIGRKDDGVYQQDLSEIRPGDKNSRGQIYLVRNIMYEPVDGKHTVDTAYQEAVSAYKQGLPLTISTHRYNFTRSEAEFLASLAGLNELLVRLVETLPELRFLSSPELGGWYLGNNEGVVNDSNNTEQRLIELRPGMKKSVCFFYRLWYRHKKIRQISILSGLILPVACFISAMTLFGKPSNRG